MKLVFVPLKDVFKECKGKRQFSIKKDAYRRFSSVSNEMQIGIKKIAALYIRASAVGVIMSLSRIGTIVSTWALPIFINNYGISNTMLMEAGISLFGLLISVAFAPETRGMSLAQTSNMTIRGQRMG